MSLRSRKHQLSDAPGIPFDKYNTRIYRVTRNSRGSKSKKLKNYVSVIARTSNKEIVKRIEFHVTIRIQSGKRQILAGSPIL